MNPSTFLDQHFHQVHALAPGEYEGCLFADCLLHEADLSACQFSACTFERCDLSLARVRNTSFRDVRFKECKMLGLRLDECKTFLLDFAFEDCQLNMSSFFGLPLKGTAFHRCSLVECEFVEADLTEAVFEDCNLAGATFDRTNLIRADLRTARQFIIDPEINPIRSARFSPSGLEGLLVKYGIRIEP